VQASGRRRRCFSSVGSAATPRTSICGPCNRGQGLRCRRRDPARSNSRTGQINRQAVASGSPANSPRNPTKRVSDTPATTRPRSHSGPSRPTARSTSVPRIARHDHCHRGRGHAARLSAGECSEGQGASGGGDGWRRIAGLRVRCRPMRSGLFPSCRGARRMDRLGSR
jgi:hypothetical protein